ncbi:MAG TPA: ATP-dependent DNA helicase UvrD2 [Candidatus Limnocylindria bacterium]|nr:ATP-dependent DNA helicase UvrD2 [Candidatus Limnocylindria bacterium]
MPPNDADAVLAALDPEQRAVAEALTGPVCVLAGAGTGKTRAITHRIAYGVHAGIYTPQRVLAVTFTARAAGEMRGRLRALGVGGVQARTFHAAALRQLRYFWPRVVGGEVPRISDRKVPILAEAAGRLRLAPGPTGLRDLAAEIEWAKVTRTAPEDYPAAATRTGRTPPLDLDPATMGRVFAGYEEAKRGKGLIDFEDVLLLTVAALEERRDVAEEVRGAYRHFVVDEYQDVNPLQQRLLELWLGDRDSLCVVGDASQTIYSFTGASPSYLLDFPRRWPGAEVVRLVRDYRSTPQVVALANRLLSAAHGPAAAARLELIAQRPTGPEPVFLGCADEPAEAAAVATEVRALLDGGVSASEIAVLFRINAQSEAYEDALTALGIPYVLRGGERFFERPEVKEAVLLLRGAARASEANAGGLPVEVGDVLAAAGWDPAAPPTGGAARERWESLAALVRLAEDFAATRPEATLRDLVGELEERAVAQHAPTVEGVTLASLHAAKGLEWDAVFLVGLVDGMVPIIHAQTAAAIEEERRLLYVGVTRAREHLSLSWSWARNPGGARTRKPSRFLDGLRPVDPAAAPVAGRARAGKRSGRGRGRLEERCHICRSQLVTAAQRKRGRCDDCPPDYDEAFYDLLRTWRLERARADSVPAYVVFTDATLEAIAVRRPSSRAELSAISGVGATKLERYSDAVIALVSGSSVEVALASASDTAP